MKTKKTWKERIMTATTGRNSRGVPLWYAHDQICKRIAENEGVPVQDFYRSISAYLLGLVKSGHLERAVKPVHLMRIVPNGKPEYLYRQTGKSFNRQDQERCRSSKNVSNPMVTHNAILGHSLWCEHKKLPRWFRKLMLD